MPRSLMTLTNRSPLQSTVYLIKEIGVLGARCMQSRAASSIRPLMAIAQLTALLLSMVAALGAAQPAVATGSLSGTVFADSGDVPVANAEISFPNLKLSTRSDNKGNFRITGVPAGAQELNVRVVGYEPFSASMTFRIGQKVEVDFILKSMVTRLPSITVKATADPRYAIRLMDFERRREEGIGRFLSADVFEKADGQDMSQVLMRSIPGIRTVGKGSKQVLASRRGNTCVLQVIVNNMTRFNGREEEFDINSVITGQVLGLEYYTVASTPPQFSATSGRDGGSHCGTVVIWTK